MQEIQFDFFRGTEAEQYTFYRIPKVLFTAECFQVLSCEAKILYGLLLDRMGLSIKNRWIDKDGRVYIIFTVEEIAEQINCGIQKAVKLLKELDGENGIGLIEKKRLGFGKPNIIYVKNFLIRFAEREEKFVEGESAGNHFSDTNEIGVGEIEKQGAEMAVAVQNDENHNSGVNGEAEDDREIMIQQTSLVHSKNDENHNSKNNENHNSRMMKNEIQECLKSQSNDTDINNTDRNNIYPILSDSSEPFKNVDRMDGIDAYREKIKEQISYWCFQDGKRYSLDEVNELLELMVEVMIMPDEGSIQIARMKKPISVVKSRFMKLNQIHIEYVLQCLEKNTGKVGNIKAYLLTALYNAPLTINNYYMAEVKHDLYGK